MKRILTLLLISLSLTANAEQKCEMNEDEKNVIEALFSKGENIHSLLWWDDPESKIINARSFIINGHDSIPIFSSEAEAKTQISGSALEKDLVSIQPGLLAGILQGMEYSVLNPGGSHPIQFKSCVVSKYVAEPDA